MAEALLFSTQSSDTSFVIWLAFRGETTASEYKRDQYRQVALCLPKSSHLILDWPVIIANALIEAREAVLFPGSEWLVGYP